MLRRALLCHWARSGAVRAPCLGKHTVWETEITQVNKQAVTSWWGAVRKRQGEGWKCFDGDDVRTETSGSEGATPETVQV